MKEVLEHLTAAMGMLPGLERIAETQYQRNLLLIQINAVRLSLMRAYLIAEEASK
jgi:hypothetical protein